MLWYAWEVYNYESRSSMYFALFVPKWLWNLTDKEVGMALISLSVNGISSAIDSQREWRYKALADSDNVFLLIITP